MNFDHHDVFDNDAYEHVQKQDLAYEKEDNEKDGPCLIIVNSRLFVYLSGVNDKEPMGKLMNYRILFLKNIKRLHPSPDTI